VALIGTQTTRHESGDNRHIALLPNTLWPIAAIVAQYGGGGYVYVG